MSFFIFQIPPNSILEGCLQMRVSCELTVSVDHHGFLTMFEDVSGFGAWHRRWCLLKGATLSYWKYPDDEKMKTRQEKLPGITFTGMNYLNTPDDRSNEGQQNPQETVTSTTTTSEPYKPNLGHEY